MNLIKLRTLFPAELCACALFTAPGAMSATYLTIEGVDGEVKAAGYEDTIEIASWSWGANSTAASGRRSAGVCVSDMSLNKFIDKASTDLIMSVISGELYPEATLTLVSEGGDGRFEYLVVTMREVSVGAFTTGGSSSDDRLIETFSLNFSEADWTYYEQDSTGAVVEEHAAVISGGSDRC